MKMFNFFLMQNFFARGVEICLGDICLVAKLNEIIPANFCFFLVR